MIDLMSFKDFLDNEQILLMQDNQFKIYIRRELSRFCSINNIEVSIEKIEDISSKIFNEYRGLGILEEFLSDPDINEIMINGYDEIYIEKLGEINKSEIIFRDKLELERIIQKIVGDAGREVNQSNPIVDAMLYDGSRINIVLPPISKDNPCITIRKFFEQKITINQLISFNTVSEEAANFLSALVKTKYNIIIGGGTSSGKTTFLNALSEYIPSNERIITIEDSRELQLYNKDNLISLETRNPNNSKRGKIDIKDLIKNSLRMRPDRIIVGEVRADETLDMLQAMNTGHEGALTTAHANSTKDMISRLETMVLRSSSDIPLEAIKRMINSAIEFVIYLKRVSSNKRRVTEIAEILQDQHGETIINIIFKYDFKKDKLIKVGDIKNIEKLKRGGYE